MGIEILALKTMEFALSYIFYLNSELIGNQLRRRINSSDVGEKICSYYPTVKRI